MRLNQAATPFVGLLLATATSGALADETVKVPMNRLYCSDPYFIVRAAKLVRNPDISAVSVRRQLDDAIDRKACFRARRELTGRVLAEEQDWVKLRLPSGAEVYILHPSLYDSSGILKMY